MAHCRWICTFVCVRPKVRSARAPHAVGDAHACASSCIGALFAAQSRAVKLRQCRPPSPLAMLFRFFSAVLLWWRGLWPTTAAAPSFAGPLALPRQQEEADEGGAPTLTIAGLPPPTVADCGARSAVPQKRLLPSERGFLLTVAAESAKKKAVEVAGAAAAAAAAAQAPASTAAAAKKKK